MKKYLLYCLLLTAGFIQGEAQNQVTLNEAKKVALNTIRFSNLANGETAACIDTVFSVQSGTDILLYEVVFSTNSRVLVSGNKLAQPVLGFFKKPDNSSIIDINSHIPLGLRDLIEEYSYQIRLCFDSMYDYEEAHSEWSVLLDTIVDRDVMSVVVDPLIETSWTQDFSNDGIDCDAYNYYSPFVDGMCVCLSGAFGNYPVGCVAVAMQRWTSCAY